MADKKIYIPSEDLVFFNEAEAFSGKNISKLIRELVKKYVEDVKKEMDDEGFWIVTLEEGLDSRLVSRKFRGKLLGENPERDNNVRQIYTPNGITETEYNTWGVYLTKKHQILIYQHKNKIVDRMFHQTSDNYIEIYPDFEAVRRFPVEPRQIYLKGERHPINENFCILDKVEIPLTLIERAERFFYTITKSSAPIEDI